MVLLLEYMVVVMKGAFLYKHVQSSRTNGVFSTTKALLLFKAARTLSTWSKWVQSSLFL